jgi:hypothetical protein
MELVKQREESRQMLKLEYDVWGKNGNRMAISLADFSGNVLKSFVMGSAWIRE